ncbi:MAG: histidinol dehydrogenase [Armatimonadota bacterium]
MTSATSDQELLRTLDLRDAEAAALAALLPRPAGGDMDEAESVAREIVASVRERGDQALLEYEREFDCPALAREQLAVTESEIAAAYEQVDDRWLRAARRAIVNVRRYHEAVLPASWSRDFDGVQLGQQIIPVDRAGIYAPAGKAPLPSSLIMSAIPARVAGVRELIVASPPNREGAMEPIIVVAARECQADAIYKMGGAQAIAAMAYGTETIPKVDVIAGPGNPYVVAAKRLVYGEVGIESLPGPSETCVIADGSVNAAYVAADLLSQAEHGRDSPALLVTDDQGLIASVNGQLASQLAALERADSARESLRDYGAAVLVCDMEQAVEVTNALAPEHCQVLAEHADEIAGCIRHAGCIFVGEHSTVPLGDYLAGPSHVLPTNRTARFSSALSVDVFLKKVSTIKASAEGLANMAEDCIALAEAEGLTAHAEAVRIRRDER